MFAFAIIGPTLGEGTSSMPALSRFRAPATVLALSCATAVQAQPTLTPLLQKGESVGGQVVQHIRSTRTAGNTYAALLELSATPDSSTFVVWGYSPTTLQEEVLLAADQYAPLTQVRFDDVFGLSTGADVAVSALVDSGACSPLYAGSGYIDSLWLDMTGVAVEGDLVEFDTSRVWRAINTTSLTRDGRVSYVGFAAASTSVFPTWSALVLRTTSGVQRCWLRTGSEVASTDVVSRIDAASVSPNAEYAVVAARLNSGNQLVTRATWNVDGTPLLAPVSFGGSPLKTGEPVHAVRAAAPDSWLSFQALGTAEPDPATPSFPKHWYVVAQLSTAEGPRSAIVQTNGVVHFVLCREGGTLDGETLIGSPEHTAINAQGDVVSVWRTDANGRETLFLNDTKLLSTGSSTAVPLPGSTAPWLSNFLGMNTISVSDRDGNGDVAIYFIGHVGPDPEAPTLRTECLYRLVAHPARGEICRADWNADGTVNSTDVGEFINSWFADQAALPPTLISDFDGNGVVNSTDVGEFINFWFEAQAGAC